VGRKGGQWPAKPKQTLGNGACGQPERSGKKGGELKGPNRSSNEFRRRPGGGKVSKGRQKGKKGPTGLFAKKKDSQASTKTASRNKTADDWTLLRPGRRRPGTREEDQKEQHRLGSLIK